MLIAFFFEMCRRTYEYCTFVALKDVGTLLTLRPFVVAKDALACAACCPRRSYTDDGPPLVPITPGVSVDMACSFRVLPGAACEMSPFYLCSSSSHHACCASFRVIVYFRLSGRRFKVEQPINIYTSSCLNSAVLSGYYRAVQCAFFFPFPPGIFKCVRAHERLKER